ncbi:MAG: NAD(P)H-quinone dehydrogenase, partial [Microlunatus sp.]|nr:NAD(P)H-quinone dehydrogenase [Microlunatus sp.]
MTRVVIVGGGPGGYEAALVASQLGGEVTLIDTDGLGGSAVLTDCVPSKTLIATAEVMTGVTESNELGIRFGAEHATNAETVVSVDLAAVNARVLKLADRQSSDIAGRLEGQGVTIVQARGRLDGPERVIADTDHGEQIFDADVILIATGAHPRVLPDAVPDGERILTWTQVYALDRLPEKLIVVGSGVTGAEFASAYDALGAEVVLVSSRDRVLPGEDADAAQVLEDVFSRRGLTVLSKVRAESVTRDGDRVLVRLDDGREIVGSHALLAVGSIPNTAELGLVEAGVTLDRRGFVSVDKVSRTSARGIYAAGDCTGVLMLASVAAMQGRIAMWHALGDAVAPLDLRIVSSNVFTDPEIATVGRNAADAADNPDVEAVMMPLSRNPRA